MKKIVLILGLAFITALSVGCGGGGDKTKMAAKKWRITKFEMADMTPEQKQQMQESLKNATFDFRADGTTTMQMGEMKKEGKWRIEGNDLILVDESKKEEKNTIKTLTDKSFCIEGKDGSGKKITVEMEPAGSESTATTPSAPPSTPAAPPAGADTAHTTETPAAPPAGADTAHTTETPAAHPDGGDTATHTK